MLFKTIFRPLLRFKGKYFCAGGSILKENPQTMLQAIEAYEKALKIFEGLGDKYFIGAIQSELGIVYNSLPFGDKAKNLLKAIEFFEQALKANDKLAFPVEYAMIRNNLGAVYFNLPNGDREENLQNAIACYQEALEIRTKADFPVEYALTQYNLGLAYDNLPTGNQGENHTNAIICFQKALEVRTKTDFPVEYAETKNNLGIAYDKLPTGDRGENLTNAITCYQKALEIRTKADFPVEYAGTLNNLGLAYWNLPTGDRGENLKSAITCYQQALEIYTEMDFPVEYAATQNNLGLAYTDLPTGDLGENLINATTCYQKALEIRTKADFPVEYAETLNNLGKAYWSLPTGDRDENFKNAINCYQEALNIGTKTLLPVEYATTLNNLGNAYSRLTTGDAEENFRNAIAYYQQALEIYTKEEFPIDYAMTQGNLGNAYADFVLPKGNKEANLKSAITCYQQALEIYTEAGFPVMHAMIQGNLGIAYSLLPRDDRGENLQNAIACYQKALDIKKQQKLWEDILKTSKSFIQLYFTEKDWEKVIDLSQDTISIYNDYWDLIFLSESKKVLSNLVFEIFRMLSYALFQKGRFLNAIMVLDEGSSRYLSETLRMGQELPEGIPVSIKIKIFLLYEEVRRLQPVSGKADQIEVYKERLQKLKELMEPYRPKGKGTLQGFLPHLRQEKAALLYLNVTSCGGFYALVHDNNPGEKDMFSLVRIGYDAVNEFYWNEKDGWFTLYNQDRIDRLEKLFERAEEKIQNFANQSEFKKILKRIEELGIKKLTIIPQGILHTFPFVGIKDIPEDLEICFAPNAQLLLNSYQNTRVVEKERISFTAFANPCEDAKLFFTNAEGAYIFSLMHFNGNPNAKIHWGRKGNKQAIFIDGQKSSLLHFSTHGFYDTQEIENSCLFLFQDQLHLRDIYQLELPSCFMIVMSACETGMPDINSPGEYSSLSAGFHQAGAKVVVSTLWPVFDLSTSLLMGEFYRCFLNDGVSPAFAMRQAQKWLRESHPGVIVDRLKEYQAVLKAEKEKLSMSEEPWTDSQTNRINGSLMGIESQINKLRGTNVPPFQNPYYWAGFVVNGWGF